MSQEFTQDALTVKIFSTRAEMGAAAATDIEQAIQEVLAAKANCNIIFAAAPSQNDVLSALVASDVIDWPAVHAYHMDEYIGLPPDAPQRFAHFLYNALFDRVPFGSVNCLNSMAEPEAEAARYTELLRKNPADIVVMGIGENGHIAFNDPHVALFDDPAMVKQVTLDEACRLQQVHDGCFPSLGLVPKTALTLTIPALVAAKRAFCIVPGKTKTQAVFTTIREPIAETCPASILRRHPNACLYLDKDSAEKL